MAKGKLPVSIKGVVLRKSSAGSDVLLLRNNRQEWELPGGRIDGSETPEECGDSDEADRHSELIAITVPGWIRSVVGAKRRWRMDFPESDRDRQACCC